MGVCSLVQATVGVGTIFIGGFCIAYTRGGGGAVLELTIGDKVFCTKSTGLPIPAKVVGHSDAGYVELEYHQDGVRVVNHGCSMHSISFGIPSLNSPPP